MMMDKMHTTMDNACKKASEFTGVSVRFPKPSKQSLKISAFTNGVAGVGFILFGVLSPYKWLILLGALGILGAIGMTLSIILNSKAK